MAKWNSEKLGKDLDDTAKKNDEGYTQRQWDRTVGIGAVPDEYAKRADSYQEKIRRYDRG